MRTMVSILACLITTAVAAGPVSPEHLIEPFVTRSAYEAYCRQIEIGEDEDQITRMLYEDYVQQLVDLQTESERRATEAGADRLAAAYEGRGFMGSEELRETRIAVQRSYTKNWSDTDRLFEELVESTAAMVPAPDPARLDRALGDLRRRIVLESIRRNGQDRTYAGDGLDVIELLRTEELDGLPSLQDVIVQYATRVNGHVESAASAERSALIEARIARIARDNETSMSVMRGRIDRWRVLHGLNEWAIESVAYVLGTERGPAFADAWRVRTRAEYFPWLHKKDQADLIFDWISANTDEAVRTRAQAIMDSYLSRRDELRREFETLLLLARSDHGFILGERVLESDPGSAELRASHLRLTGELSLLESRTVEQLEAGLTSGQRAAARRSSVD